MFFNAIHRLPELQLELVAIPHRGIRPMEGQTDAEFQKQIDGYLDSLATQLQVNAGITKGSNPASIESAIDNWVETNGVKDANGYAAEKDKETTEGKIYWYVASNFLQVTITLEP